MEDFVSVNSGGGVVRISHIVEQLTDKGYKVLLTGSRVIGGSTPLSDFDILVLGSNYDVYCFFYSIGITLNSGGSDVEDWITHSMKSGYLNIITTECEETFNAWSKATEIAKALELTHKPGRLACFEHFLKDIKPKIEDVPF